MTRYAYDDTGTRTPWFMFGGVIIGLAGIFNAVLGLVALVDSGYYVLGPEGMVLLDLTGWGWLHLVVGVFAVAVGVALSAGVVWARVVAVLLAGFNALTQLLFVSASPWWSVIVIALDVLVIWAVLAHGDEPENG